jgi:predicted transcriptional regulator of viral defense system
MKTTDTTYITETTPVKARDLPTWLLAHGISAITTGDIAQLLDIPSNQVPQRLAPLQKKRLLVSAARGLWVPVPPEFASWGAPPAIEIIDATMKHLNADYYVGWLSAAAIFGAAHHAPQVFQVAATRAIRSRSVGRSKINFYHRRHIGSVPIVLRETRSGTVVVSAPETTLLDISNDLPLAGGLDNAANIIITLCEESPPDMECLAAAAALYPAAAVRRLGWMLEKYTDVSGTEHLLLISDSNKNNPSKLLPTAKAIDLDSRWNLYINAKVEVDV